MNNHWLSYCTSIRVHDKLIDSDFATPGLLYSYTNECSLLKPEVLTLKVIAPNRSLLMLWNQRQIERFDTRCHITADSRGQRNGDVDHDQNASNLCIEIHPASAN